MRSKSEAFSKSNIRSTTAFNTIFHNYCKDYKTFFFISLSKQCLISS
ncbi:hypothetical protein APHACPA_1540 [Rickettsia amblyommatis str. Ac/Pa]|uniref:Uncharacterized protein n=1 Tax=Rickettsia amblyommatis str. Ac/Pa TaxID=1359164 RepID=A0A0F3N417_RICAM|nr:hypothetical protein APHACPA_1540 [Rickettsia amblyommatis str. Ac/Pa]